MEEVLDFLIDFHVKHGIGQNFYFATLASRKLEIK